MNNDSTSIYSFNNFCPSYVPGTGHWALKETKCMVDGARILVGRANNKQKANKCGTLAGLKCCASNNRGKGRGRNELYRI